MPPLFALNEHGPVSGTPDTPRKLSRHHSIFLLCQSEGGGVLMTATKLPVLFVSDLVVLPGMVVPLALDESSQAAIDAARAGSDNQVLVAPRVEDYVDGQISERTRELAEEYKRLVVAVLQRREAWQVIDQVHQMSDPSAI